MSSYNMSNGDININNINIKNLNKIFEGIDFSSKKVNNSVSLDICQSCGSNNIIEDSSQGVIVCTDCGQVLDTIYDNNPEWKQFDDDDKNNGRCVAASNILLPQSSLGTSIKGYGKTRLKTLHSWNAMPYRERTLNGEFKKINTMCQKGSISKCIEEDAKIMCKMVNDRKHKNGKQKNKFVITRGIKRIGINAGCVFLACLKNGATRTPHEISNLYNIKESEINKGCKEVMKILRDNVNIHIGTSKAEHFIKRYCDELQIKNIFITQAITISQNIEKLNIGSDHTPYSVAAASILLMAELYDLRTITKKKIAYEFSLSEVTISKTYKELEACKNVLLNSNKVNNIVKKVNEEAEKEEISDEIIERMKKFGILPEEQSLDINSKNIDYEDHKKFMTTAKTCVSLIEQKNKNIFINLQNL